MANPLKIIAFYPDENCSKIAEHIRANFINAEVQYNGGFSLSPRAIWKCWIGLQNSHDISIIQIPPPFNYFKELALFFLFLFTPPEAKTFVVVQEKKGLIEIKWHNGFKLILFFLPALLLNLGSLTLSALYTSVVPILLAFWMHKKSSQFIKKYTDNSLNKVIFLAPSLQLLETFQGSTAHVRGVVGAFKKLNWNLLILAPGKIEGVEAEYRIIPPVLRYFLIGGAVDMIYDLIFTFKAFPIIKKEKPDFLYQRHGRYSISGVVLSNLLQIPLVLEMNALLFRESALWSSTGKMMRFFISRYEKICIRFAHRISAISTALRNELESLGVEKERVFVNPNGADADVIYPGCGGEVLRKRLKAQDKVITGFSGSFHKWHGVDTLAETIIRTIPFNENLIFFLMGDGPELGALQKKLNSHNIEISLWNLEDQIQSAPVIWTGRIPPDAIPACLDACDILISPIGKGKEYSSPIKIFEYMAAGKAILCFDIGQMSEILENRVSAMMTPPDEIEPFIQGFLELICDREMRESLGKKAREKLLKEYTWEANIGRIKNPLLSSFPQ